MNRRMAEAQEAGAASGAADAASTWDGFMVVQKNRNSCIHWLLRFSQRIEAAWADEAARLTDLALLKRCLEFCREHAHADCRELGALAPRMLHRLDFEERHFLNLMMPIERKYSKGLRDHEFLPVTTDDRPEGSSAEKIPLQLVLDHLRSAFNVGALFRTADCLGVSKMWLCGYTATPEDATAQKTSMGAHAHVAWEWRQQTLAALEELRASGVPIVALETVADAPLAQHYTFPPSGCALLLGNERHGLSDELLKACDAVVRLPCRGVKNSMNVAVSAGMCGYEIARQWAEKAAAEAEQQKQQQQQESTELIAAANLLAEAEDYSQAASLFRRAAELQPCIEALEPLAQCLLELDEPDAAATAAAAAVEHDPRWPLGWLTYGRALLNSKRFGEAWTALQQAIALDPQLAEEAAEDLAAAERMHLKSEEAVMHLHDGTQLRIQQWRAAAAADSPASDSGAGERTCAHQTTATAVDAVNGAVDCTLCVQGGGGSCRPCIPADRRHGVSTVIWECSIVLAKMLDAAAAGDVPRSSPLHTLGVLPLRGRRVIELGSGCGAAGLAAAALGATVLLTDLPDVQSLLRANAQLNEASIAQAGGAVRASACVWEEPEALPEGADECEIVLAADVLYQRDGKQLAALCAVLRRLLAPSSARPMGGLLLLAHKARHASLDESVPAALRERAGVELTEVPFEHHHHEFRSPTIKCYVGRRADASGDVHERY